MVVGLVLSVALPVQASADLQGTVRYGPFFFDRSDPSTIFLAGEIDVRSNLNFLRIIDASGEARNIVLVSDGGLVHVALPIAMEIRRRGLSTFVPAGFGCYSACSFLWFAGVTRHAEGEVGVHQLASPTGDLAAGQLAIGDIIEVLTDFGVPSEVIVRMLQTPSSRIHVFTEADLQRFGLIDARRTAVPMVSSRVNEPDQPSIEQQAINFISQNNRDWSRSNPEALSRVRSQYGTQIDFYGSMLLRERVMQEKHTFANRWPVRDYFLDKSTARAVCDGSICVVTGEVVWDARSPERNAISRGRSVVEITLDAREGGFLIIGENGRVIARY